MNWFLLSQLLDKRLSCRSRGMRFLLALLISLGSSAINAAFCSLRDPVFAIKTLFPESNQHRSIVQTVTRDMRDEIGERLPFTLHFNELGRHTLFVAQLGDRPLGFVHARTEPSDWGLIEIAWAIQPDLTVKDFQFQRCRDPACNETLRHSLLGDLTDKNLDEIREYLSGDGKALASVMADRYQANSNLVLAIIRSSLKTIATTEMAWSEDVKHIRRVATAIEILDLRSVPTLVPVTQEDRESLTLPNNLEPDYSFVDSSSISAYRIVEKGKEIARLVEATWNHDHQQGEFMWLFSETGQVLGIERFTLSHDIPTTEAFSQLIGKNVASSLECTNGVELAGNTLYLNAYKSVEMVENED